MYQKPSSPPNPKKKVTSKKSELTPKLAIKHEALGRANLAGAQNFLFTIAEGSL